MIFALVATILGALGLEDKKDKSPPRSITKVGLCILCQHTHPGRLTSEGVSTALRQLGFTRDEERQMIIVHTRHNSYPRGTPPQFYVDTYTLPADGYQVEHARETRVTGERIPGLYVP